MGHNMTWKDLKSTAGLAYCDRMAGAAGEACFKEQFDPCYDAQRCDATKTLVTYGVEIWGLLCFSAPSCAVKAVRYAWRFF